MEARVPVGEGVNASVRNRIDGNGIPGSDGPDTAAFEIGLWFQTSELNDWTPADQSWRVEG